MTVRVAVIWKEVIVKLITIDTKYVVDGKEFDDYNKALAYKTQLEQSIEEKRAKALEKSARYEEVCDAYEKYSELEKEYNQDYGGVITFLTPNDILEAFYGR